jgi:hypothetical protein
VAVECIFGDWSFDLTAACVAAFRPEHILPLAWEGSSVTEVSPADGISRSVPYVALAAHWAEVHPDLLAAIVGPFEVARFPRTSAIPW